MPAPNDDAQKTAEGIAAKTRETAESAAKTAAQEGGKQVDFLKDYLKVDSLQGVLTIW